MPGKAKIGSFPEAKESVVELIACVWNCFLFPSCTDPDSFCYKKFFQLCGLSQKTPQEVKDVFRILDEDNSGFIEESELKYVECVILFPFINLSNDSICKS